jgi:hypothetical protein
MSLQVLAYNMKRVLAIMGTGRCSRPCRPEAAEAANPTARPIAK